MSVFYYIACGKHRVHGPAVATQNIGGWQRGDPQHRFIERHRECKLRVLSEYAVADFEMEEEDV